MKGFTLIELLAVIVILAIIALIATPIVLGIINDSKNSATIRSAEFYVDAVKNAIMKKNLELNGTLNPEVCEVIDKGNVKCDEVELEVEVDGEVPDSGTITFDRGRVTSITLTFGERTVVTNANGELVLEDNASVSICTLIDGESNEIGSKYECEVKLGTKYNFYVLSHEEDGTTNLIMERNICEDGMVANYDYPCTVPWINQEDYYKDNGGMIPDDILNEEACYIGGFCFYSYQGPVTAMTYLNNATSTWSNIENLNITYDDEEGNFTGFVLNGKARMPYKSEVNDVGCEDGTGLTCPIWMADYLQDVGPELGTTYQENPIDGIYGYWTFSSVADDSHSAWYVSYEGYAYVNAVFIDLDYGVRPVINLEL